jgi:hypothetical protein
MRSLMSDFHHSQSMQHHALTPDAHGREEDIDLDGATGVLEMIRAAASVPNSQGTAMSATHAFRVAKSCFLGPCQ